MFLAAAWAVVLVYGSLLPFDADPKRYPGLVAWLTSPRWFDPGSSTSTLGLSARLSDVMVNLALYAPLGLFLRLAIRRHVASPMVQVATATAAVGAMSWLVECTQSLSPARVASLNDVAANTVAGGMTALLAVVIRDHAYRFAFWAYRKASRIDRPKTLLPVALAIAFLAPLLIQPTMPATGGLPFAGAFELPYDVAAVELGRHFAVYALLALLVALQARAGWRHGLAWVTVAVACVAIAAQVVRMVTANARFDPDQVVLALGAAAAVGVALTVAAKAVRARCRRREAIPVAHERRRRVHSYGTS